MGLHLPTWGFISFAAATALIGLMLFWETQFDPDVRTANARPTAWRFLSDIAFIAIAIITAGNVIIGYTVCGASLTCAG
jgi:hypothetical protein